MKNTNLNTSPIMKTLSYCFGVAVLMVISSCSDLGKYELPDANSRADETPPSAAFSATQGEGLQEQWKDYTFSNGSISATTYLWNFGDGETSTEFEPQHTYPGEGIFTVSLTATDDLGVSDTFTMDIEIVQPEIPDEIIPLILEPSFEDNSLPDGTGDGRDSWRNSDLGSVIQINGSSSVPDGSQAAKLPTSLDRVGYQEVEVTPNTDYRISYKYRVESPGGFCTVSILAGGGYTDLAVALDPASALTSFSGAAEDYTSVNLLFNSGANNFISILLTNTIVEARIDDFTSGLQQ